MENIKIVNPKKWYGLKYPDSDLIGLVMKFAKPNKNDIAIDIGCGTGRHIKFLNEIGYNAFGIDADKNMIEACKNNGVEAYLSTLENFKTNKKIKLAIGWGFSMVVPKSMNISKTIPKNIPADYIILDWRTKNNSFNHFENNIILSENEVIINKEGHVLNGLSYTSFNQEECILEGYEIIASQKVTKELNCEINEWYQVVYKKL